MTWLIQPRDTLVLRDGRPFDGVSSSVKSVDFPWPSSIAGVVRTCLGTTNGTFDSSRVKDLLTVRVRGPLLERESKLWVPAPRDQVRIKDKSGVIRRYRLAPGPAGLTDLTDLDLVGPIAPLPEAKPEPWRAWWSWEEMSVWLSAPQASAPDEVQALKLPHERRSHVVISSDTRTGEDGLLFATDSIRLNAEETPWVHGRLAFDCDRALSPGTVRLGGEGRISFLSAGGPALPEFPATAFGCRLRVVLLTPALFNRGYLPTFRDAKVVAAAVGRPMALSGWDYAQGGPKRIRHAAPAGSVYWVEPLGTSPEAWAKDHWMQNISDDSQDQLDGFGLCAVGVA